MSHDDNFAQTLKSWSWSSYWESKVLCDNHMKVIGIIIYIQCHGHIMAKRWLQSYCVGRRSRDIKSRTEFGSQRRNEDKHHRRHDCNMTAVMIGMALMNIYECCHFCEHHLINYVTFPSADICLCHDNLTLSNTTSALQGNLLNRLNDT